MRAPRKLQVGDTIKCRDINDMLKTMSDLGLEGVKTDFYDTRQCVLIVVGVEVYKKRSEA